MTDLQELKFLMQQLYQLVTLEYLKELEDNDKDAKQLQILETSLKLFGDMSKEREIWHLVECNSGTYYVPDSLLFSGEDMEEL